MSKPIRILVIFLLIDVLVVAVYFLAHGSRSRSGQDLAKGLDWVVMDAYYQPASELEEFIKTSSDESGVLPLQFHSYGPSAAALRKFRGSKLAGAGRSVLGMTFQGLEDWALVDLWIKGEEGREIRRTVLYVLTNNSWKVGDSGRLAD